MVYGARPTGSPAVSHVGAKLVATANEVVAVTDVVSQVPHKVSFVSSPKTANSLTRDRASGSESRIGVGARARVRIRAKGRV